MPLPSLPFDDDKLHEECGVFGVIGVQDAASFVALGLHALQHRGQPRMVSWHFIPPTTTSCTRSAGSSG